MQDRLYCFEICVKREKNQERSGQLSHLSDEQKEFVHLLTSHQKEIRGLCCALMPIYLDEVDDVMQETNRVVLEKSSEYRLGTNFKAWVFTIAKFQVMAHFKQKSRNKLFFSSDLVSLLTSDLEHHSQWDEKGKHLIKCYQQLNQQEKDLLNVRYAKDTSLVEYSEVVSRTVGGLKRSLCRIREKLRICITQRTKTEGGFA